MSDLLERGRVWTVTLDRPDRANALSAELVERLHAVVDEAESVRPAALVVRGNARHFAAGFDLDDLEHETDATLALRFLRIGLLLERIIALPCATVAVVEGPAVGAGADLVLACDHRLVARGVTLRFPGRAFGVTLGATRRGELGAGQVTGTPDHLHDVLHAVSGGDAPGGRAIAGRPPHDADAELAALARSVAVPGLRDRVASHAARSLDRSRSRSEEVVA